jgi:hypothetical protein
LSSALSEEFSSRVAESTRLILVKDGFGGDLGAFDRRTDEHRKDTEILEWFGPLERNTLRPLWYCIDCESLGWNLAWTCVRVILDVGTPF